MTYCRECNGWGEWLTLERTVCCRICKGTGKANTLSWVAPQECLDYWAEVRRRIQANPTIIKIPPRKDEAAMLRELVKELQEELERYKREYGKLKPSTNIRGLT